MDLSRQIAWRYLRRPTDRLVSAVEVVSVGVLVLEGERGVASGRYLAKKLGVEKGQSISITVPVEDSGSFLPRSASFVVTNVFDTGFYEFDARWLFIDLREAEALLNVPGSANLLEVKLVPGADLDLVARSIDARTDH